ncbi:hypothetical protein DPMN_145562 [Dreissena polymorpha]|uniref:Uncharacterized protein n=1 Tax=Dreissena polymorpha TaxID=45954 RepID=A0A9D4F5D4_DREPO|nr:hypothetical protein DPMN_145562 [Dreissena polymorpha]
MGDINPLSCPRKYHGASEEKFMYAVYNDEPPNSKKTYSNYGHTEGMQLMYNHPVIYDKSMPATFADKYPKMAAALDNATVQGKSETTLYSWENVQFQSFAKSGKWGHDLYADLLASEFRDSMYVETWQRRESKMCSNCTGTFKV